ncbi:MAG: 6-phosphogluconolactonase [Polyangiaceae bacterium]|nr:6-phosphogluconolactonase [Polyangiaceae bacterium]
MTSRDVRIKYTQPVITLIGNAANAARVAAWDMAEYVREAIADHGAAYIALSGGSTPIPAYEAFAQNPHDEQNKEESIDWCKVHVFWVDERAAAPTSDRSNYFAVKKALVDRVNIPEANVHRMLAEAENLEAAAAQYEAVLRASIPNVAEGMPQLDLVVLGVGDDGHTASLFPGDPAVHVRDKLAVAVAANAEHGREARMTLTAPILENARDAIIITLGKSKYEPCGRALATEGSVDETPARIIQNFRGCTTWLFDSEAHCNLTQEELLEHSIL